MSAKDPFGFGSAAKEGEVDLTLFAPKAKATDVKAAEVAAEVAQSAGFTRRTEPAKPERRTRAKAPEPVKGSKRRVNIQELIGVQDRYPDSERAQINMLCPVPVVVRWRDLCKTADGPAWVLFERALDALEAQTKGGRS